MHRTQVERHARSLAAQAAQYCRLLERPDPVSARPGGLMQRLEALLPRLQVAVARASRPAPPSPVVPPKRFQRLLPTLEQCEARCERLRALVRPEARQLAAWHRSMIKESDSADSARLPLCDAERAACLEQDLVEIYGNLREGLAIWESGWRNAQAVALSHWCWTYYIHWGSHAARAAETIYELRSDRVLT